MGVAGASPGCEARCPGAQEGQPEYRSACTLGGIRILAPRSHAAATSSVLSVPPSATGRAPLGGVGKAGQGRAEHKAAGRHYRSQQSWGQG